MMETRRIRQEAGSVERKVGAFIHLFLWSLYFFLPYLLVIRFLPEVGIEKYLDIFSSQFILPVVFYLFYFLLVPRYLFQGRNSRFFLDGFMVILAGAAVMTIISDIQHFTPKDLNEMELEHLIVQIVRFVKPMDFLGSAIQLLFVAICSSVLQIVRQWVQIRDIRKDTELQNLHNQLNPHFLLNTLNNIYALIAFDPDRAQEAVQEVSRLLRYVLYDNQDELTLLSKEMDFIASYVELMKIRIPSDVDVRFENGISPESHTLVAPLLFISLIENAFKHGVDARQHSYIHIRLREDEQAGTVTCEIRNSNYPKSARDKSGSGIGLSQVKKRLGLIYPGRHIWQKGVTQDGGEYFSILTVSTDRRLKKRQDNSL